MSTINATNPTLLDMAKITDPDGKIAPMVELLQKRSPLLQDMTWQEGNLPTGHRFASRTALPTLAWRKFNEGVTPSKSAGTQVDETVGMLAGRAVVDCDLAKLNGNEAAFRASEEKAFVQSFHNEIETGFFYHSTKATPEKFMGLAPRLDSTSIVGAGSQIIAADASASGADQTSIWIIGWSPETVFGIFPKGSQAGLQSVDMGQQLVDDGTGKSYRAWVSDWSWKMGLVVKDYRYVVRIANVDTGNLLTTGRALITALIKGVHQMQGTEGVRPAIYCNRRVGTYLHLQTLDATTNSTLSFDNVGGKMVNHFMGIPIRTTDALLNTEAAVS